MILRPLILDRYVFREFVLAFVAVMSFCALLILVASIFEKFGDIMEHDPPLRVVVLYFATSLPYVLMQIVPIAAMLAVLFSIGGLARYNEVLALLTSGVHSLRIAAPVLFAGFLIALGSFVINESVIPPLQRAAKYYELQLEGKDVFRATARKQFMMRGRDQRYYLMRLFNPLENRMISPVIVDLNRDGTGLTRKIEADEARLLENVPDQEKSLWQFKNPRIWSFDGSGRVASFTDRHAEVTIELEDDLHQLLAQEKSPEEMNFRELSRHIGILKERGQPTGSFQTDLLLKVMFPLGIIVVLIIGYSYAVRTRAGTAMTMLGYGIVWAFGYYGLTAVLQALGHSGALSPYVAAFLPTLLFAAAAAHYLHRSSRWYA